MSKKNSIAFGIRLDSAEAEMLSKLASRRGYRRGAFVRKLIQNFLSLQESVEPPGAV